MMLAFLLHSMALASELVDYSVLRDQLTAAQRHLAEPLLVLAEGTDTATRLLPLAGVEPLTVIRTDVADEATALRELPSYGLRCAALVEPAGTGAWTVSFVGDCAPSPAREVPVESDVEPEEILTGGWDDIPVGPELQRRAFVVTEADGEWGVYRLVNGDAVTARALAKAAGDEPLATNFRNARVGAYVGGGLLVGGGAMLGMVAVAGAYLNSGDDSQFTAIFLGAAGLAMVGVALPIATTSLQNDLHTYYDEDSARAAVEAYHERLRKESMGHRRRSLRVTPVITPGQLAIAGTF